MVFRRALPLYHVLASDPSVVLDPYQESIGLALSFLMVVGIAAIAPLSTAVKRAEETLRESEERFHLLSEVGLEAIALHEKGVILDGNSAFARMFGYDHAELIGKNVLDLAAPQSRELVLKHVRSGREEPYEAEGLRKDGSTFSAELSGKSIPYHGKMVRVSTLRDITERKREAEEAARMVTVVRDSNDAITIQDFDGRITAWNRGAELMYGYSEEEALAMNVESLTAPGKVDEQRDFVRRLVAGEAITSFETQRVTNDGRILDVWMTVTKLVDKAGKPIGIASTERDITQRKRAEEKQREELERRVEQRTAALERSNKELEQFAYVASHDLQEPLRMVASYTQLLERRYKDQLDDTAREFIAFAVDGANRMQRLINDLLAYSRVQTRAGEPELVELSHVLGQARANLATAIEESGALVTNDGLPVVMADPAQLLSVLQNLIGNAVKFHGEEPPHVHVSARESDSEVEISVRDNGIGIRKEHQERIFLIFQRLHNRKDYPGTGIGLALCKRIVERHGGRIWVESEEGGGATFTFTLPTGGQKEQLR
jgi:PAS domain S-box-containing protein